MQKLNKRLNTLVTSSSFNPWFNLSVEEVLLKNVKENEIILFLWQNKDSVVIGRNQNPWKECSLKKMDEGKVKLARRLSGGGAVYHDIGNLNFTFLMRKVNYNLEKQLDVILQGVNSFGLNAVFSGRNDILIEGKKFSGNAYYFDDKFSYHHGTILIDSDISKLSNYLNPSKEKIVSKGIDSVRSRVVNLHSISKDITVEKLKHSIQNCFEQSYGQFTEFIEYNEHTIKNKEIINIYEKYSSWQWIYGESPVFDVHYENKFKWGEIQVGLSFENGYITNSKIYTDALNTSFADRIKNALIGVKFNTKDIVKALKSIDYNDNEAQIYNDIFKLF